jgi:hypothetical protein
MKPFKWNYSALKPLDIFLSYCSINPLTAIIRIDGEGLAHAFDKGIATHAGFIINNRSEMMSAEETGRGFITQSLEKYCTSTNQIVYVWRWDGFRAPGLSDKVLDVIAWLLRKNLDYGWATLLTYPKWLRWLRPIFKIDADDHDEVCSECVFKRLREAGLQGFPEDWDRNPPAPNDLHHFFLSRLGEFSLVNGWK